MDNPNPGYHLAKIQKGVLGKSSKIQEELDELKDAEKQQSKILALVELSDMIGAINVYLEDNHPGTSIYDLINMADITRRAFENGHRK